MTAKTKTKLIVTGAQLLTAIDDGIIEFTPERYERNFNRRTLNRVAVDILQHIREVAFGEKKLDINPPTKEKEE